MTTKTKIYIALAGAGAILIAMLVGAAWSDHKVRTLEKAVTTGRERAAELQKAAAEKELDAARYREKTEYLERRLAEITTNTRKQDEQLEKLSTDTRDARARVARARGLSSTTTGPDELCKKLADAGHPCRSE